MIIHFIPFGRWIFHNWLNVIKCLLKRDATWRPITVCATVANCVGTLTVLANSVPVSSILVAEAMLIASRVMKPAQLFVARRPGSPHIYRLPIESRLKSPAFQVANTVPTCLLHFTPIIREATDTLDALTYSLVDWQKSCLTSNSFFETKNQNKMEKNHHLFHGKCADACLLPRAEGPCSEKKSHWYYDQTERRCMPFYYGGCQGNANNFETQDSCEQSCRALSLVTGRHGIYS